MAWRRETGRSLLWPIVTCASIALAMSVSHHPGIAGSTAAASPCLDLHAAPGEHLARALANAAYADCLDGLALRQARGCEPRAANDPAAAAYWACAEVAGCDIGCGSRAVLLRELAELTREYHFFLSRCRHRPVANDCEQARAVSGDLQDAARRLAQLAGGLRTF